MDTLLFPSSPYYSLDQFANRFLSSLLAWGFNGEAVAVLLERCAGAIERLDVIESCLCAICVCDRRHRPNRKQYGAFGGLVEEDAIAEECRNMLEYLDKLRIDTRMRTFDATFVA